MEDVIENNNRLEKLKQERTRQFLERITNEKERLQHHRLERERALQQKRKLQEDLETEKQQILKDFEIKKKNLALNNASFQSTDDLSPRQVGQSPSTPPNYVPNKKNGRLSPLHKNSQSASIVYN